MAQAGTAGSPGVGQERAAWRFAVAATVLFAIALLVRLRFHAGFALGDDAEEFLLLRSLVDQGPSFEGHLRYRFPMWVLNYWSFRWLGLHEASFFLPTWLLSSLLPVVALATLRAAGIALAPAVFAGLFVALSPFEVLIGGLRANDLFVEFSLAVGLWAFVRFEGTPRTRGVLVAVALWLAFYAKLWSAFLYPVIGVYYLRRWWTADATRGLLAFTVASALLHGAAATFWRLTTGVWLPFLTRLSATYPVPGDELGSLFLAYPRLLLVGSEYGTTLFGVVPHLLGLSLLLTAVVWGRRAWRERFPQVALDRIDVWLIAGCTTFFLLLEFFPNNFTFDRYYSVPRIFRYLAPLSFGLSLLAAKRLAALASLLPGGAGVRAAAAFAVLVGLAWGIHGATAPGRSHRARVLAVEGAIEASCPPALVVELWQGIFFRELRLRESCPETPVRSPRQGFGAAPEYAAWLSEIEPELAAGTLLLTGLDQFVYYTCHVCGFRLTSLEEPLDARWVPVLELPPTSFDAASEPVRLWRWTGSPGAAPAPFPEAGDDTPSARLFELGMERFDDRDYPGTRRWMAELVARDPEHALADDAAYFHAVSYWREMDAHRTIEEFERFLARHPDSRLAAAAHFHIGLAQRQSNRPARARAAFREAIRTSRPDDAERRWATAALEALPDPAPFDSVGRALTQGLERLQRGAGRIEAFFGIAQP